MRKTATVLLSLVTLAAARAEPPAVSDAKKDEGGFLTHEVRSPYQAGATLIRVLLPDAIEKEKKHPVVYVLPVEAGGESRYGEHVNQREHMLQCAKLAEDAEDTPAMIAAALLHDVGQFLEGAGDAAEDSAKVLKFIREYKVNFPVWIGATTDDMERFGVGTVLPATVIVDREGKIVWREIGIVKAIQLKAELDKLLLPKVAEATKIAKAEKAKTKNTSLVPA